MSFSPPASGHGDELLSASVDGELTEEEHQWLRDHLARCGACADERTSMLETKQTLRGLPSLDSDDFIEPFLARHRALVRSGLVFVGAASMMLGTLALTAAVVVHPVAPDVDAMVAAHLAGTSPATMAMGIDLEAVDNVGQPYTAPDKLPGAHGLARAVTYAGKDLTTVIYRANGVEVSVFQIPGKVDWDGLDDGQVVTYEHRRVWRRSGMPVVLVAEAGHVVVVVVSRDEESAREAIVAMPDGERDGWRQHLHDAGERVADIFSFHG
jgi:hypothetical protein